MKMLIVFTVDSGYIRHLAVALTSFVRYHDPEKFIVGVIYKNISPEELLIFQKYVAKLRLEMQLMKIEYNFGNIKYKYHFNETVLYRLVAPHMFTEYKTLLYLDSDIIFV